MEPDEWLKLVLLTLVAIASLLFAAGSAGGTASTVGLLVAAAAIAGVFVRIKQYFDRIDAGHR